jgi:RNA polymerase sigma-70 factor (ECF subfamily)
MSRTAGNRSESAPVKKIDGVAADPGMSGVPCGSPPLRATSCGDCLDRDPEVDRFSAVYGEHFMFVWRTLRALGVPAAAADDAAQDVFVVVHRRLDDYDARAPIRAWLFGIARNVARRHRERAHREPPLHLVGEGRALDDTMQLREAASLVERFLDTLDEDQRAVFVLAQLEGLTAPEIAEALGVNPNTVYSRLRTARLKFERAVARHAARDRRAHGE